MAVSIVSTTTAVAYGTSCSVNVPTGTHDGHYLVLHVGTDYASNSTVNTPSGWTLLGIAGTFRKTYIFTRTASSEPSSYTLTAPSNTGWTIEFTAIAGSSNSISNSSQNSGSSNATLTANSLTGANAGDLLLCAFTADNYTNYYTTPSGMTVQAVSTNGLAVPGTGMTATEVLGSSGATGSKTTSISPDTAADWSTYALLIPANGNPAPGNTGSGSGSTSTITVTMPSGITNGDLLLLGIGLQEATALSAASQPTNGAWNLLTYAIEPTHQCGVWVYYRIASSEPGSYTFNAPGAPVGGIRYIYAVSDITGTAGSLEGVQTAAAINSTSLTLPSITTQQTNELLWLFAFNAGTASPLNVPSGMTSQASVVATNVALCATQSVASSGATGTRTVSVADSVSSLWAGVMVSIPPVVAATPSSSWILGDATSSPGPGWKSQHPSRRHLYPTHFAAGPAFFLNDPNQSIPAEVFDAQPVQGPSSRVWRPMRPDRLQPSFSDPTAAVTQASAPVPPVAAWAQPPVQQRPAELWDVRRIAAGYTETRLNPTVEDVTAVMAALSRLPEVPRFRRWDHAVYGDDQGLDLFQAFGTTPVLSWQAAWQYPVRQVNRMPQAPAGQLPLLTDPGVVPLEWQQHWQVPVRQQRTAPTHDRSHLILPALLEVPLISWYRPAVELPRQAQRLRAQPATDLPAFQLASQAISWWAGWQEPRRASMRRLESATVLPVLVITNDSLLLWQTQQADLHAYRRRPLRPHAGSDFSMPNFGTLTEPWTHAWDVQSPALPGRPQRVPLTGWEQPGLSRATVQDFGSLGWLVQQADHYRGNWHPYALGWVTQHGQPALWPVSIVVSGPCYLVAGNIYWAGASQGDIQVH